MTDFLYGSSEQLNVIAADPAAFIKNFFLNFILQGKEWIIGALGRFGYSYLHLNDTVLFIHGLALIAISVLDSSQVVKLTARQRFIIGAIALGTIGLIAGGLFYDSPVGAHVIFGLQGRYFIPVLPLILLLNLNRLPWGPMWETWKGPVIASYSGSVLAYTVIFIKGHFY
jgi:uncharacterized membrane protein